STSISKSPYCSLVQSQPPLPPLQTILESRTSQQSPLPETASQPLRSLPLKIGSRSSGAPASKTSNARARIGYLLRSFYCTSRPSGSGPRRVYGKKSDRADHKLT